MAEEGDAIGGVAVGDADQWAGLPCRHHDAVSVGQQAVGGGEAGFGAGIQDDRDDAVLHETSQRPPPRREMRAD